MMPVTRWIRFATSPRRIAWMSGMPPATLPSKPSETRFCSALATISSQCVESRALLAVTTCLPASIAARMSERAGSIPPMSSITTCTSGSFTTARASVVKTPGASPSFCARDASRSAARVSSNGTPSRLSSSAPFFRRISTVPVPMLPSPRMPTLIAFVPLMPSPPEREFYHGRLAVTPARRRLPPPRPPTRRCGRPCGPPPARSGRCTARSPSPGTPSPDRSSTRTR